MGLRSPHWGHDTPGNYSQRQPIKGSKAAKKRLIGSQPRKDSKAAEKRLKGRQEKTQRQAKKVSKAAKK